MAFSFNREANVFEREGEVGFKILKSLEGSLKDFRCVDEVSCFICEGQDGRHSDDVVLLPFKVAGDEGVVKRDFTGFVVPVNVPGFTRFGEGEGASTRRDHSKSIDKLSFETSIIRDRKRKHSGCSVSCSHERSGEEAASKCDGGN